MIRTIFTIGLLLGLAAFVQEREDRPLTIYAAASLSPLLEEISGNRETWGLPPLTLVTGSSGSLARQIDYGAPADIYITAHREWLDSIETDHQAERLFGNRLVIAGPCPGEDHASLAEALETPGRIATGDPSYAPLGQYTQRALETAGLWNMFERRLIRANDAQAALRLLTTGAVDRAFLYESDIVQADGICTLYRVSPDRAGRISYWALPLSSHPAAQDIIALLRSAGFAETLSQYGYLPGPETANN